MYVETEALVCYFGVIETLTDPLHSECESMLNLSALKVTSLTWLCHCSLSAAVPFACVGEPGWNKAMMASMGPGFTSGGQESESVFSTAVCKIQASKCYIESLPLVPKDKRSCFSQGERSTVQLPLDHVFTLWK